MQLVAGEASTFGGYQQQCQIGWEEARAKIALALSRLCLYRASRVGVSVATADAAMDAPL